jgi:methylmalonyl-CoA mutase C-terminal domain/subunit
MADDSKAIRPIRVLLAKIGFDPNTTRVTRIAKTLRDAGIEVIYSGLEQMQETVVTAAIQEGVDGVVVDGGEIADEQRKLLREKGVQEVFTMDTPTEDIVARIEQWKLAERAVAETGEK